VEIHWTLESPLYPIAIDAEELWTRARASTVADVEVLVLSPEDMLLHLCLHTGFHHLYANGLRAFCDIRETIRHHRDETDWEAVRLRALQWGAGNSVCLTLYLAHELLGAEVPNAMLEAHKQNQPPQTVLEDIRSLVFRQSGEVDAIERLLRLMSSIGKVRFVLKRIFLSRKELAEKYSLSAESPLTCLHYPVRLKDLLVKHGQTVRRLFRRDNAALRQRHLLDWMAR
jgi:hypothetical protein